MRAVEPCVALSLLSHGPKATIVTPRRQGIVRFVHARFLAVVAALSIALGACRGLGGDSAAATGVAPEFAEWLEARDLADEFGDSLGPAHTSRRLLRQTFVAAELIYDPEAERGASVRLAPLGLSLGLAEPPVAPPGDPAARYFPETGHTIYTGFLEAYGRLGGEGVVGAPISEVRFEEGLIYQSFENLGFYREEEAAPSDVYLMAFGLASLGEQAPRLEGSAFLPPGLRQRPFAEFLDLYGGESFFGRALSGPYVTADGTMEQIFERAVLWARPDVPAQARLRPLGLALGPADPPVEPSADPGAEYVSAAGHNIHPAFTGVYEALRGGQILGLPLGEARADGSLLSQRFENGILEYHDELPAHIAVQLAPLGLSYTPPAIVEAGPTSTAAAPTAAAPSGGPVARTWVEHPILEPGDQQRIYIEVLRPDGTPWSGAVPLVRVAAPQGAFYPRVSATGPDGRCSVSIQLDGLPPGEIITYEVVVSGDFGTAYAIGQFAASLASSPP